MRDQKHGSPCSWTTISAPVSSRGLVKAPWALLSINMTDTKRAMLIIMPARDTNVLLRREIRFFIANFRSMHYCSIKYKQKSIRILLYSRHRWSCRNLCIQVLSGILRRLYSLRPRIWYGFYCLIQTRNQRLNHPASSCLY